MKSSHLFLLIGLFFLGSCNAPVQEINQNNLLWEKLPDLPASPKGKVQPGLAGAFSGTHNGALIVAGGANFPNAKPWDGGEKIWWDDIYVLTKDQEGKYGWHVQKDVSLPRHLAYGVSISTPKGVICIGGNNKKGVYDEVFRIKWDPQTKSVKIDSLPDLPHPLAFMTGAKVGNKVFIAGGLEEKGGDATKNFWALDLSRLHTGKDAWTALPSWPGPGRIVSVSASQSNGKNNCFYLFSGRKVVAGGETQILSDGYRFNPVSQKWTTLGPIRMEGQELAFMGAPAIASGANHILIFGGAGGERFKLLEKLSHDIQAADSPERKNRLIQKKTNILETHSGFSHKVLAYHTITNTWATIDSIPYQSPVTTKALRWDGGIVIPSGEVRPGVRTPDILKAVQPARNTFGWLGYSILAAYLALMVAIGIYLSGREKTTDDYFKAGERIPWWAAGISIFGTQLSAITFMAIPAKTYATDWGYFILQMTIVLVAPVIIYMFLPFFRRLNITTAYEYLEKRFNLAVRLIGSCMFMALQFGRIGIVLLLPALALSVVTGIDVYVCILVMGGLSIFYTVLGGIEADIWTDVAQVVILVGGAVLCLIMIPFQVEGGISHMVEVIQAHDKINIFNFNFDFTSATFWVVLIGGIAANLVSYGSDQSVIQRYLTTRTEEDAARSIWINALLSVMATLLFFAIGTALFVFYQDNPMALDPAINNADTIFPLFIVTQLPDGIAGLLIAGVFAAAMSSLDSSMNSVSSVVTTDFFQRFKPNASDKSSLNVARWATAIVGVSGTIFALVMAQWEIKSLWDQLFTFIGLFAGGLGGIFILAIFTRRTHGTGAVIGLLASGVIQLLIQQFTPLHVLLYTFTGMASCIIIGYLSSIILFKTPKENDGLTIFSLRR